MQESTKDRAQKPYNTPNQPDKQPIIPCTLNPQTVISKTYLHPRRHHIHGQERGRRKSLARGGSFAGKSLPKAMPSAEEDQRARAGEQPTPGAAQGVDGLGFRALD